MQAKTDVFRVSVATILLMSLGGCANNMPLTESRAVEIVMQSGFPKVARCAMQIERERAPVLFQEVQRLIDTGTFTETTVTCNVPKRVPGYSVGRYAGMKTPFTGFVTSQRR